MPLSNSRTAGYGLHAFTAVRVGYLGLVLLATLVGLRFDPDPAGVFARLARALSPSIRLSDAVDGIRNVVLFAGLGVVWLSTSMSGRVWSGVRHATAVGFALSVVVEALQLFSPSRVASVLDVASNTAGALLGALAVAALALAVRSARGRESHIGVPAFLFAGAYTAAAVLEAFAPLLRQQSVYFGGPLLERLENAVARIPPDSLFAIPYTDIPLFFPAGVFSVAAMVEMGDTYRRAWWRVAVIGAVLATVAEFAHGVASRPIVYGAILAHSAGIALGAWSARTWLPGLTRKHTGRRRLVRFLAVYAALLLVWAWRPFRIRLDFEEVAGEFSVTRLIPMLAYTERMDLFTVPDVGIPFFLYLPLGGLLAVWPVRHRGPLARLWPVFYLSLAGELGQVLIAGRFFDVTDILIQFAGAFVGWVVVRRSGYPACGEVLPSAVTREEPLRSP